MSAAGSHLARLLSFLNSGLGVLGLDKQNHAPDPPLWARSDLVAAYSGTISDQRRPVPLDGGTG